MRAAPFRRAIERFFPFTRFSDLRVPLTVSATDLDTGERILFGAGGEDVPLADALMASCALPLFYPAVTVGGRRLGDGGLRGVLPLDLVPREARRVVAVDIGPGFDELAAGPSPYPSLRRRTATPPAYSWRPTPRSSWRAGEPMRRARSCTCGRASSGTPRSVWTAPGNTRRRISRGAGRIGGCRALTCPGRGPNCQGPRDPGLLMRAADVMVKDPMVAVAGAMASEVAIMFRDRNISVVPVVDDHRTRRFLGTLSDRDIVTRCVAAAKHPMHTRADELMRTNSPVVGPGQGARRLPCSRWTGPAGVAPPRHDHGRGRGVARHRLHQSPGAGRRRTSGPRPECMPDFKLFTLEEAERTLPLVRRIVATYGRVSRRGAARWPASSCSPAARGRRGETPELVAAREDVARHADRINVYLQELEAIGCVFKGFDGGLVDFYSLRDDQPIFLCWRLGEDRITHWHESTPAFAGRQPIDGAILSAGLVTRSGCSSICRLHLWLGGAIAAMIMGIAAKRKIGRRSARSSGAQRGLMKTAIAPGALLTVLSGPDSHVPARGGALPASASGWSSCRAPASSPVCSRSSSALPTATKLGRLDPRARPLATSTSCAHGRRSWHRFRAPSGWWHCSPAQCWLHGG